MKNQVYKFFNQLPVQTQIDLINWYNISIPNGSSGERYVLKKDMCGNEYSVLEDWIGYYTIPERESQLGDNCHTNGKVYDFPTYHEIKKHIPFSILQKMVYMVNNETFKAWDCLECGDRILHGNPDNWDDFQGVNEGIDRSYFGNPDKYNIEYLLECCNHCRGFKLI
jgi:hypothetical protein